jgi:AcrR family transcriptional regulator
VSRVTATGRAAALMRAARQELAGRGCAAVSNRSIAGRAGISTSVLYHYYPSRQQLLEAVILQAPARTGPLTPGRIAARHTGPALTLLGHRAWPDAGRVAIVQLLR